MSAVEALIKLAAELFVIISHAVKTGDTTRADEILASPMKTSIEKHAAEIKAREKFGPRET